MTQPFRSIEWTDHGLRLLDQRKLPHVTEYVTLSDYKQVIEAIKNMTVRGAPAIAISGAFAVCLAAKELSLEALPHAIHEIGEARPTAVNLRWAMESMCEVLEYFRTKSKNEISFALLEKAHEIYDTDVQTNLAIAKNGFKLVPETASILHHCNTGSIATADYGTALGIIRYAHEQGRRVHAYLDETRPRLQGASLSTYELQAFGVPHTLIVDSASGFLMKRRKIDMVLVGCDRVALNGDVANKIGTYNLALAAKAHAVPFYVACSSPSLDPNIVSGNEIPIEERAAEEITTVNQKLVTPEGVHVWNPAFDVTPHELVTGFITEKGLLSPPYGKSLMSLLKG